MSQAHLVLPPNVPHYCYAIPSIKITNTLIRLDKSTNCPEWCRYMKVFFLRSGISDEIESHNEFQESILGKEVREKVKVKEVDIRNYAKHILRKRPLYEKRELLSHLRSKLILKEKQLSLV